MHPATRCLPLGLALLVACDGPEPAASAERLEVARFTEDARLERPDITEWVFMGTNLGVGRGSDSEALTKPGSGPLSTCRPNPHPLEFQRHSGSAGRSSSSPFCPPVPRRGIG